MSSLVSQRLPPDVSSLPDPAIVGLARDANSYMYKQSQRWAFQHTKSLLDLYLSLAILDGLVPHFMRSKIVNMAKIRDVSTTECQNQLNQMSVCLAVSSNVVR